MSDNVEIRILATWSFILPCYGNSRIKNPSELAVLLNHTTFFKGVKCVFGFTDKCFCVSRDDLDYVIMEGLGSKPLRIHLEYTKDV